jgi:hypothetical protein
MPIPPREPEPVVAAPQTNYPSLEALVERVSRADVSKLFARLKESLGGVKGARSEQAKKAKLALERTEELIVRLLDVRESLGQPKGRVQRKH